MVTTSGGLSAGGVVPDYDFFRGKQMTIVYPSSPGAFPVEEVAERMGELLELQVTVRYVMQNGTVGGTNAGATAANDGLTIGVTSIGGALAALLTGPSQFDFDFQELQFLGAVGNSPSVLVSSNPELASLEQLHDRADLRFVAFPNSRQLISSVMLATMFDLRASVLTGYQSSGEAAEACRRGDGDVAVIALDQILNADNTNVAEGFYPLMRMGDVPAASKAYALSLAIPPITACFDARQLAGEGPNRAYAVNHNFSDSSVPAVAFFVPPGTALPRYLALEEALRKTFEDPDLSRLLADKTVSSELISPGHISSWLRTTIEADGPLITHLVSQY